MTNEGAAGAQPFLAGARVLDMSEMVAGPHCAATLSDLGAEVVKVERLGGDPIRRRVMVEGRPPVAAELLHRNKDSVVVDIDDPRGVEIVIRLAGTSDVFVENFRPGALDRRGLGADELMGRYPRLVYCSISGFGRTGPLRDEKAVDVVAQGHAGLMSVTGDGEQLAKAGFQFGDIGAAMWAVIGILGALRRRDATGLGARVDVALADALVSFGLWEVVEWQSSGVLPEPKGTAHRYAAPYQAVRCGDGRLITVTVAGKNWEPFAAALGRPELVDDPRFGSDVVRYQNREPLVRIVEATLAESSSEDWIARFRAAGVPAGKVNDIADVLQDEQYQARRMFPTLPEGPSGVQYVNCPIDADGVPGVRRPAPRPGSSTRRILRAAGYRDLDIDQLAAAGVIQCEPP